MELDQDVACTLQMKWDKSMAVEVCAYLVMNNLYVVQN